MNAYPNPFDSEIKVDIEHNLFDASLEISMDIFSLNGTLIRSVSPVTNQSQGYYSETLYWDGRTSNGGPAGDGLYLLRVTATDGKTTSSRTARVLKITK
jgi:flagellar hook assembly protein FlgD